MIAWLHETILWSALAIIMSACIYLSPGLGLMIAGAGAFWISRVLKRDEH